MLRLKLLIPLILMAFVISSNSGWAAEGTWETVWSSGISGDLQDVCFVDGDTGWAVGEYGTIAHTSDGGITWTKQDSGVPSNLYGVYFVDSLAGWAVGEYGTIVHTSDGGETWEKQESGIGDSLLGVHFVDRTTGWVVGHNGFILYTSDGGITWTKQESGTRNGLWGIHFVDRTTGWVVGHNGFILYTSDGGITWTRQESGTDNLLLRVYFADSLTGWVVGEYGIILHTSDGGVTWTKQDSGTDGHLSGVCFVDSLTGWVVGRNGVILHTSDGGGTWEKQDSGTDLYGIHFVDRTTGWAVGWRGIILHTSDGGVTWAKQTSGTDSSLYAVHFVDNSIGWAVGSRGIILHTSDGGATWDKQDSGTVGYLIGVHFVDSLTGWVAGSNIILYTSDGGVTWEKQYSGTGGYLRGVFFVDSLIGWAVGDNGIILHTSDGGTTWEKQISETDKYLYRVYFVDSLTGWAGSYDVILHTSDGGVTWGEQTSGTDYSLYDIHFVNRTTGWAVGYLGVILHTSDGGETWARQDSGTYHPLWGIHFVDRTTGWAVGWRGIILHTLDGGITWTKQESGIGNDLRDVYFADQTSGWAVGDSIILKYTATEEPEDICLVINQIPNPPVNFPEVQAFVSATYGSGEPIADLSSSGFTVTENDRDQTLASVQPVEKLGIPLSVILAMNHSASLSEPDVQQIREGARSCIKYMYESDRMAVVEFAGKVQHKTGFTNDESLLHDSIDSAFSGPTDGTSLYDAVSESASLMRDETGRKAIILITDGSDDVSVRTSRECIYHSLLYSTPVFTIGIGSADEAPLKEISGTTGGIYYHVDETDEVPNTCEQIMKTLQAQYEVVYRTRDSQRDGSNRFVEITYTDGSRIASDTSVYQAPKSIFFQSGWRYLNGPELTGSRCYPRGSREMLSWPYGVKWTAPVVPEQILTGDYYTYALDADGNPIDYHYGLASSRGYFSGFSDTIRLLGCVDDADGDCQDDVGMELDSSGGIHMVFRGDRSAVRHLTKSGGDDSSGYPVVVLSNKIIASFDSGSSLKPRGVSAFNRFGEYEIWHYEVGPHCQATSVWDIDRDGEVEIAISCASAGNGIIGYGYEHNGTPTSDSYFYTIVIDEDGEEELTVDYSSDGENTGVMRNFFVDLNRDGTYEILALEGHDATHPGTSQIHMLSASTGDILETFNGWENMSWCDPVIADVNGDGQHEVVVSRYVSSGVGYSGQYVLSSALSLLRSSDEPGKMQFANDLDGDGDVELALITGNMLKIVDGNLLEETRFMADGEITSAIVSDTDNNGRNEIYILADKLYVLEGSITGINVVINQIPTPLDFPVVKCYVSVTDKEETPITGLTEDNFIVTEDGVEQRPISVVPVGTTGEPISVVLALDCSSSMYNRDAIDSMGTAARNFIQLMGEQDRACIVKFSTLVEVTQPFTGDKSLMNEAIDETFSGIKGATSLYDAIYESASQAAGETGRKAIVVITDAEDTNSSHTLEEAVDHAVESGVPVFVIALGSVSTSTVQEIANGTGGKSYSADRDSLLSVYDLISQTLRDQYEITYTTSNYRRDDTVRLVTVTATYNYLTGSDTASYWPGKEKYPFWDTNQDGKVDVLDIVFVGQHFGEDVTTAQSPNPDVNGDRVVDILDVVLIAQHFGEVYPPGAPSRDMWSVVPEHIPVLVGIYNSMPKSDPRFTSARTLLERLIFSAQIVRTEAFQNYPNPFNPETWIPYQLAEDSEVVIRIHSLSGHIVKILDLGMRKAGIYLTRDTAAYWDGTTDAGEKAASGIYFYTIQAGDFTATRKMTVVR